MVDSLTGAGYDPVEYVPTDSLALDSVVAIARRLQPDIALVDLNLGAERSGIPLIGPLVGLGTKVIAFTASDDPLDEARCVEAGAVAFLHKATAFDVLLSTIERVAAGDELISSGQRQELLGALGTSRAANDQRLARLATLTLRRAARAGCACNRPNGCRDRRDELRLGQDGPHPDRVRSPQARGEVAAGRRGFR